MFGWYVTVPFIKSTYVSILFFFLIFSMVLSDLFLSVLEYNLKEIAYAADVAQLGYVMWLCFLIPNYWR